MKKVIFTLSLVLSVIYSFCQVKKADEAPKSKLETFSESSGSMVKKEYFEIDKVKGVKFQVLKLTNVSTGTTLSGLRLEAESGGSFSSTKTAFLDADELDGLIKALTYVNESVLNTPVPANDVEFNFHARSGFSAGVFNYRNKWLGYVKLERFDSQSQFDFAAEDFQKVVEIIKSAKTKL
ncbi:MAG TPA: hypothetical protein VHA56_16055 [Mucilaginibacter sp.]|nr:hypothetical protein [Mucilaginibacter sp.]